MHLASHNIIQFNRYKVVRQFSYQVPAGDTKKELLDQLDKVPTYGKMMMMMEFYVISKINGFSLNILKSVQTLQFTVKEPTVGKSATFIKVDHVIQETKKLMNIISKVVSTCFDCASKVKRYFII